MSKFLKYLAFAVVVFCASFIMLFRLEHDTYTETQIFKKTWGLLIPIVIALYFYKTIGMEEITIKQYAQKVKAVRDRQNDYFAAVKAGKPLQGFEIKTDCIKMEKDLDKITREIITGEKQGEIF